MKTRSEVSAEKLRGGFYTPARLVAHAVERLGQLVGSHSTVRVLEPSIGDGAFIEGLASATFNISELVGIEILGSEADKASARLESSSLNGTVINDSTLSWSLNETESTFDAVVGNLPFVRFQFVSEADRKDAACHATELGISIGGVANLWLPMLLASLRKLRRGGAFVLVLPAECLTGVSAGSARKWLLANVESLRCDLYPAGSFPGALQEIVLLSGRIARMESPTSALTVALHSRSHSDMQFADSHAILSRHVLSPRSDSWTRFLLTPQHLDALEEFENIEAVHTLGKLAKFEVAIVTGANAFFSLTAAQVADYDLGSWVRPLLPRSRFAPGLVFNSEDYASALSADAPMYLLDASLQEGDRSQHPGLDEFLAVGEGQELHLRYKCRIRSPWWAVPGIRRGDLFLSKRCHRHPRMILNETAAVTTDTIYRGRILRPEVDGRSLVAGFHNSGTLLSAELEGRNFGGGVLELVPSEVSRLQVPLTPAMGEELDRLDRISREAAARGPGEGEAIRHETDLLLRKAQIGVTQTLLDTLADARSVLMTRRLDRTAAER
ncbi:adenine-specific DNA-methyltransferase [Arthrobacter sp. B3I9]|uniref:N-6 DNA methylase n=1 Tax=Arthrobacter sp. B3I9 TaxID=3042270 RepID=UPI0027926F1C|nr:N-6 DNA methylase [Arthrobacter sp. B3I9]MDQ0851344.1 adenine-specific DNA-methyltransferase [Arthrobacter sp. B3I9]